MNTHTPIQLESQPVLAWNAPRRPDVQRTKRWYTTLGVIVFIVAAYGIFTNSWMLAIVSILAGGMYVLIHDHRPPTSTLELFDSGIRLDGDFIRWDQLAGFWFLQTHDFTELRFVSRTLHKKLVIQTGTQDIAQLRMILGQRLPELTQMKEGLLDILLRVCKL